MRLIAMSKVLGTLEDDDDIEWKPDPFKIRPDSVHLDSHDSFRGFTRSGLVNEARVTEGNSHRVPGKAEGTV